MKRTLANLFLDMLKTLDLGKWRMVRFVQKNHRACCHAQPPLRAPDTVGPTKLIDEAPQRLVDSAFREMTNPLDDSFVEFAAELRRKRIRRESMLRELSLIHRRYLETLSFDQLLRRSAEIEAREIAHTIDLSPTRDTLIDMLVRFYGDDLYSLSYEQLVEMLPDFE